MPGPGSSTQCVARDQAKAACIRDHVELHGDDLPVPHPCPSRSVNKHHTARRDAYGGTRDGRHDAQSRGRAGMCRPALDQRLIPRRAVSPAARRGWSPTSLLQTAVRQLRRVSLHLLPVIHHGDFKAIRQQKLSGVSLRVDLRQQMSRNLRSSSAPRASLSRYRGGAVAVAGDIVVVKALQMRPLRILRPSRQERVSREMVHCGHAHHGIVHVSVGSFASV